ncbi:MAG: hypothetical protein AAFO94_16070 [Bacteroidota bacterium]
MRAQNKSQRIFLNEGLDLHYNPFGGLTNQEMEQVLVPQIDFQSIQQYLKNNIGISIELKAWKGRGKTMHLKMLHRLFDESPIHLLDPNKTDAKIDDDTRLVFIDSIHRLSLNKRMRLWKNNKINIVFTTHFGKSIEHWITNRRLLSYTVKGINVNDLESLLRSRIALASNYLKPQEVQINQQLLQHIHRKYGNNVRALLNDLYTSYQL